MQFAQVHRQALDNVRTANAHADGAHSSLHTAEDRHQQETANLTAQRRATFDAQRQLMESMNRELIKKD